MYHSYARALFGGDRLLDQMVVVLHLYRSNNEIRTLRIHYCSQKNADQNGVKESPIDISCTYCCKLCPCILRHKLYCRNSSDDSYFLLTINKPIPWLSVQRDRQECEQDYHRKNHSMHIFQIPRAL